MRILVIKPDGIGDLVLLMPALKCLKEKYTYCSITVVTSSVSKAWLELYPCIDNVLTFDRSDMSLPFLGKVLCVFRVFMWLIRCNFRYYDKVYLPRRNATLADKLICLLSLSFQRIAWVNSGWKWMYTERVPVRSGVHEVEQMMGLFGLLGCFSRDNKPVFAEYHKGKYKELVSIGDFVVIISCNAARIGRRSWPVENYAHVVRKLKSEFPTWQFVVIGSGEDVTIAETLVGLTGTYVTSVAGRLSLVETAALMKECSLFIGNDSGPMHMAAAVGVPVVEVSCHVNGGDVNHANAPERFGPFGVPHAICRPEVARSPCQDACSKEQAHCILEVTVEQVLDAVKSLECSRFQGAV